MHRRTGDSTLAGDAEAAPQPEIRDVGAREAADVRECLDRLAHGDPIRQHCEALLADPNTPPPLDAALVVRLLSTPWAPARLRAAAAWAAGFGGPSADGRGSLLGALRMWVGPRKPIPGIDTDQGAVRRVIMWSGVAAALVCALALLLLDSGRGIVLDAIGGLVLLGLFVAGLAALPLWLVVRPGLVTPKPIRVACIRSLGRLQDVGAVGVLVGAASEDEWDVALAASQALQRILPGVDADRDAETLLPVLTPLCRLLLEACQSGGMSTRDDRLALAILDALERVGDGATAAPVERAARWAATEALKRAAERVLPVLRERLRQEQAPGRLLRAADAPADTAALLRPAAAGPEAPPEALLRPAASDAEPG